MIIPVKVPAVGESVTEVTAGRWLKADGERVAADEPVCEIESEKATLEITAEAAGILHIKARTGEPLAIGALLAEIHTGAEAGEETARPAPAVEPAASAPPLAGVPRTTPTARKLLEEAGLTPRDVQPATPGNRITKQDVLQAMVRPAPAAVLPPVAAPAPAAVAAGTEPAGRRERMSSLRQTIARRLVASKNETAMLTTINEVDMTAIQAVRSGGQAVFTARYGVKLGFMSIFSRCVCQALAEWPVIHARVDGADIVYPETADLCIAVSTPRGLVVPVIRGASRLTVPELELEIQRLAQKARDGKLSVEDMSGGTFTITNGGIFGSLISTPIINPPQSAVLGMHTVQDRPVARDGQVVIRPMMYISLSYDHRIIDGRESVSFIVRVKQLLESFNEKEAGL